MFFPLAKSIEYKAAQGGKENFTAFAQTSQFSWGETDKQTAKFDEGKDIKGPLTVGLLVSLPLENKDDKTKRSNEMRMVIFGDATFAQNDFARIPGNGPLPKFGCLAYRTRKSNSTSSAQRQE